MTFAVFSALLLLPTTPGPTNAAESIASLGNDLDGDGVPDFVVLAKPLQAGARPEFVVGSGATGKPLLRFTGARALWSGSPLVRPFVDVNNDGVVDFVVAQEGDCSGDDNAREGVVYFVSGRSGLEIPGRVVSRGTSSPDGFGCAMECRAAIEGAQTGRLLVGATGAEGQPGVGSGSVYEYSGKGLRDVKKYAGRQRNEGYGQALCTNLDWDSDGVEDFAVGAPGFELNGKHNVGRAEVRSGKDGSVLFETVGSGEEEAFGTALCALRRGPGKGKQCIAVASGGRASFVDAAGKAHEGLISVFESGSMSPVLALRGGPVPEGFGMSLCALAPTRVDEHWRLVVGSCPYSESGGRLYGYSMDSGEVQFNVRGDGEDFRVNEHLQAVGDIDGDGVEDFVSGNVVRRGRDGSVLRRIVEQAGEGGDKDQRHGR